MYDKENLALVDKQLSIIADNLILNGTLVESPGLIYGKMGIALFFFHYAHFSKEKLYENYGYELIQVILSQIHKDTPIWYGDGLAGIGVGINYLIKNRFVIGNDEIWFDMDKRLADAFEDRRIKNFDLYNGLIGLGMYWLLRVKQSLSKESSFWIYIFKIIERFVSESFLLSYEIQYDMFLFIQKVLIEADDNTCREIKKIIKDWQFYPSKTTILRYSRNFIGKLANNYHKTVFEHSSVNYSSLIQKHIREKELDSTGINMGLLDGYAGEGLLRLTLINKCNPSWLELL